MKQRYSRWSSGLLFYGLLLTLLVFNFVIDFFKISYFSWHLFLHFGIIIFSFLLLFYSLEFPRRAMLLMVIGSIVWIVIESILFLVRVFDLYSFQYNIYFFLGEVAGVLLILKGFEVSVKNG